MIDDCIDLYLRGFFRNWFDFFLKNLLFMTQCIDTNDLMNGKFWHAGPVMTKRNYYASSLIMCVFR